jgi:transcriptional regulator with XRE-family HTH domain
LLASANPLEMGERAERCAVGLAEIAAEQGLTPEELASRTGLDRKVIEAFVLAEGDPPDLGDLARFCVAFGLDPLDFLHRCGYFTDIDYAMGLDPLFFLNEGGVRAMMRITLRERFNNPKPIEGEHVIRRNSVIRALQDDRLLDDVARVELQMRYLLSAAKNAGWVEEL